MKYTFLILSSKSNNRFFGKCYSDFQAKVKNSKKTYLFLSLLGLGICAHAQQNQVLKDSTKTEKLDEVLVKAVRVTENTPVAHSNISKEDISKRNLGQDVPILLNYLPSVVTTSDAGAGIGYTGMTIRGIGSGSTNVTINGIPYNDAESQGTFWVNLQDFSSSVENMQIQRGVGTSTNGSSAFGASINILTDAISEDAYASISNGYGSFNTLRHNVKFSSGLLNDRVEVSGRLSKISSDGYIDRATSDLKSYFLQAAYKDDNRLIKAIMFGGQEVTYQAWYGVGVFTIDSDRTNNPAGTIMDTLGNLTGYYDNQVDDYKQDHYQLLWNEKFSNKLSLNTSLNYTYGRGFYEEYVDDYFYTNVFFLEDSKRSFLGLDDITIYDQAANPIIINSMDYARRKWLDNDFYAFNSTLNYKNENIDFTLGVFGSLYEGDHFGEVIWAQYAYDIPKDYRYYFGQGKKREASSFAKTSYKLNEKLNAYADLQYRHVSYETTGQNSNRADFLINQSFNFFNPKFGLSYNFNNTNNLYFSYARANREPSRTDFENGLDIKPEELNDFELGYRFNKEKVKFSANAYYMDYNNQLVLTGAIDNVGAPIRANSGKSYRLGLELETAIGFSKFFNMQSNLTLSDNKNLNEGQFLGVEALGKTDIAFSPNTVSSTALNFIPIKDLQLSLIGKYVGEQLMNNIGDEDSKLDAYYFLDFNANYDIKMKYIFDSIQLSAVVNNITDAEYITNGADYGGGYYVYYPQAGTNFLLGATLKF